MTTNQWWIPDSVLDTRPTQAHLLPHGATGARGQALCGQGRARWAKVNEEQVRAFCHACEAIGGRRQVTGDAQPEARQAALVMAGWCVRSGQGADGLRVLLDMLLDDPYEARRAA